MQNSHPPVKKLKISTTSQPINSSSHYFTSPTDVPETPRAEQERQGTSLTGLSVAPKSQIDQASHPASDSYPQPYYQTSHALPATQLHNSQFFADVALPQVLLGTAHQSTSPLVVSSSHRMAKTASGSGSAVTGKKPATNALSSTITSSSAALKQSKGGSVITDTTTKASNGSQPGTAKTQVDRTVNDQAGNARSGQLPKVGLLKGIATTNTHEPISTAAKKKETQKAKDMYEVPAGYQSPPPKRKQKSAADEDMRPPPKVAPNTKPTASHFTNQITASRPRGRPKKVASPTNGASKTKSKPVASKATSKQSVAPDDDYHATQKLKEGATAGARATRSRRSKSDAVEKAMDEAISSEEAPTTKGANGVARAKDRKTARSHSETLQDFEDDVVQLSEEQDQHPTSVNAGASQKNAIELSDGRPSSSPAMEDIDEVEDPDPPQLTVGHSNVARKMEPRTPMPMRSSPPRKRLQSMVGANALVNDFGVRKETVIPWSMTGPQVQGVSVKSQKDQMLSESARKIGKKALGLGAAGSAPMSNREPNFPNRKPRLSDGNKDESVEAQLENFVSSAAKLATKVSALQRAVQPELDDGDGFYAPPSPAQADTIGQLHGTDPVSVQKAESSVRLFASRPPSGIETNAKIKAPCNDVRATYDDDDDIYAPAPPFATRVSTAAEAQMIDVPPVSQATKRQGTKRANTLADEPPPKRVKTQEQTSLEAATQMPSRRQDLMEPERTKPRELSGPMCEVDSAPVEHLKSAAHTKLVRAASQNTNSVDMYGSPIPPNMVVKGHNTALQVYSQQQDDGAEQSLEERTPESKVMPSGPHWQSLKLSDVGLEEEQEATYHYHSSQPQENAPLGFIPKLQLQPPTSAADRSNMSHQEPVPETKSVIRNTSESQGMSQFAIEGVSNQPEKRNLPVIIGADTTREADADLPIAKAPTPARKTRRFLEVLREPELTMAGDNEAGVAEDDDKEDTKNSRTDRSMTQDIVDDPDKTLVEDEDELDEQSSVGSATDVDEEGPATPSDHPESAEQQWKTSLRTHQSNLFEALIDISHQLVRHLVDKETAMEDIVLDYRRHGLKLVKEAESEQAEDLKVYIDNLNRAKSTLRAGLGEAEQKLARQTGYVRDSHVSMEQQSKQMEGGNSQQKLDKIMKMYG